MTCDKGKTCVSENSNLICKTSSQSTTTPPSNMNIYLLKDGTELSKDSGVIQANSNTDYLVRVSGLSSTPNSVTYELSGSGNDHEMTSNGPGIYEYTDSSKSLFGNSYANSQTSTSITIKAYDDSGKISEQKSVKVNVKQTCGPDNNFFCKSTCDTNTEQEQSGYSSSGLKCCKIIS